MAGNEVGVEVGQEDVADLEAERFGVGQVLLNIALRVDHDRGRTGLVSEQIGRVGQAAQVILFQNHKSLSDAPLYSTKLPTVFFYSGSESLSAAWRMPRTQWQFAINETAHGNYLSAWAAVARSASRSCVLHASNATPKASLVASGFRLRMASSSGR